MPWWGWVLLWCGLLVGAAVVLGLAAWRAVRAGLAVLDAVGQAGEVAGDRAAGRAVGGTVGPSGDRAAQRR